VPVAMRRMIRMRIDIRAVFPNQLSDKYWTTLALHLGPQLLKNAGGKERMNFLYQGIILNFEISRRLFCFEIS